MPSSPLLTILLELLAPLVLGLALGRTIGAVPGLRRRAGVAALLLAAAVVGDVLVPVLGLWDLLTIAGGLLLGWVLGAAPGRTLATGALSVGLFVGVGLTAGEALLPYPPVFAGEPDRGIGFYDSHRFGEEACALAYAAADEHYAWQGATSTADRGGPVDVHLGDSMLVFVPYGDDGNMHGQGHRFPDLLDARDPAADHVNLGTPGVSYDVMLLVARRALAELPVRRVIVHALMSNDLGELGRPLACCANRELFDYDAPGLPTTCATPTAPGSTWPALRRLVVRSEPPLWLRLASRESSTVAFARIALTRLLPVGGPWGGWSDVDDLALADEDPTVVGAWARTEALLGALRDDAARAGAELVVVTMPLGPFLDAPDSTGRRRVEQLGALCGRLGVPWLDAWEAFPERPVDASLFMDDRYHLSFTGHRRVADWLAGRLGIAGTVSDPAGGAR